MRSFRDLDCYVVPPSQDAPLTLMVLIWSKSQPQLKPQLKQSRTKRDRWGQSRVYLLHFKSTILNLYTALPFTYHWSELSLMATSRCKKGRDWVKIQYLFYYRGKRKWVLGTSSKQSLSQTAPLATQIPKCTWLTFSFPTGYTPKVPSSYIIKFKVQYLSMMGTSLHYVVPFELITYSLRENYFPMNSDTFETERKKEEICHSHYFHSNNQILLIRDCEGPLSWWWRKSLI